MAHGYSRRTNDEVDSALVELEMITEEGDAIGTIGYSGC